jgi:hypothetical protein
MVEACRSDPYRGVFSGACNLSARLLGQRADETATLDAAAISAEQQYANQVAFWVDTGKGVRLPILMVENLGSAPIANVKLTLQLEIPSSFAPHAYYDQDYTLGVIPPCTISSTVMTSQQASQFGGGGAPSAAGFHEIVGEAWSFDSWLDFTDAAGGSWRRDGNGNLRVTG